MIDIVIPYELNGNAIELRYALRSAEKHLTGIGDVYLIGDVPEWYTGKHIPFVQTRGNIKWKQRNIYEKVLLACNTPEISDTFLFMNDDHYLLRGYDAATFPWYYDELMDVWIEQRAFGDYRQTLNNTTNYTSVFGRYADVHCPCLYQKLSFKSAMEKPDWNVPHGYGIKSIYCSYIEPDMSQMDDLKLRYPMDRWELDKTLKGRDWFSTSDRCFNPDMKRLMNELYPTPSRYEKLT